MGCGGNPFKRTRKEVKRTVRKVEKEVGRAYDKVEDVVTDARDMVKAIFSPPPPPPPVDYKTSDVSTNLAMDTNGTGEEQGDEAPVDKKKEDKKKKKKGTLGTRIEVPITPASTGIQI